jgi:phosphate/sulfate permease
LSFLNGVYFLPLWYQAKGASASKSGVNILPFMMFIIVGAGLSGGIINVRLRNFLSDVAMLTLPQKTGRYWYWLVLSPLIAAVGSGLLYTIHPDTPNSKVIGFQILIGFGLGGALQNTLIATQTEYAREEHLIPQGSSIINFVQLLGGVIGITVGSAIFGNQLITSLARLAPNLTPEQVMSVRFRYVSCSESPVPL